MPYFAVHSQLSGHFRSLGVEIVCNIMSVGVHLSSSPSISGPGSATEHNMLDETSIVDRHRCHMAAKFGLFVDEDHSKLPTLYWLAKLHKRSFKSRFIANSSACTTTELSILLTSCLTVIKNHVIKVTAHTWAIFFQKIEIFHFLIFCSTSYYKQK